MGFPPPQIRYAELPPFAAPRPQPLQYSAHQQQWVALYEQRPQFNPPPPAAPAVTTTFAVERELARIGMSDPSINSRGLVHLRNTLLRSTRESGMNSGIAPPPSVLLARPHEGSACRPAIVGASETQRANCHMCGESRMLRQCRHRLNERLISTFSAASCLAGGSPVEPYVEHGALVCDTCYERTRYSRDYCDVFSPARLETEMMEHDPVVSQRKRKESANKTRMLNLKKAVISAPARETQVEGVARQRRRLSLSARRESFTVDRRDADHDDFGDGSSSTAAVDDGSSTAAEDDAAGETSTYSVGDIVKVQSRMRGECKPGGEAIITALLRGPSATTYTVKYTVNGGSEKAVSEVFMTLVRRKGEEHSNPPEGRRRSAAVAAAVRLAPAKRRDDIQDGAAGALQKSARTIKELESKIEMQNERLVAEQNENEEQRRQLRLLMEERARAKAELQAARSDAEQSRAQAAAVRYHAQNAFEEQAVRAREEATQEANASASAALREARQKAASSAREARDSKAERHRCEANASRLAGEQFDLLKNTEASLDAERKARVAAEATAAEVRVEAGIETAELERKLAESEASLDHARKENDRVEKAAARGMANRRRKCRNAARSRRRKEKRQQEAIEAAKHASTAIIKVRHGDGPRARATLSAWLAQLRQMDR